jgi:hypothetical protein
MICKQKLPIFEMITKFKGKSETRTVDRSQGELEQRPILISTKHPSSVLHKAARFDATNGDYEARLDWIRFKFYVISSRSDDLIVIGVKAARQASRVPGFFVVRLMSHGHFGILVGEACFANRYK